MLRAHVDEHFVGPDVEFDDVGFGEGCGGHEFLKASE
jgi:hypothetical protein